MKTTFIKSLLIPAVLALGFSSTTFAGAGTPDELRYMTLTNNGAYTISDIYIKWKSKKTGGKMSRKFTADLTTNSACFDLSKVRSDQGNYAIQEGDEVWLVADIYAGETESSRKDKKHYYKNVEKTWNMRMGGTTNNNNSIKNKSGTPFGYGLNAGNSGKCA